MAQSQLTKGVGCSQLNVTILNELAELRFIEYDPQIIHEMFGRILVTQITHPAAHTKIIWAAVAAFPSSTPYGIRAGPQSSYKSGLSRNCEVPA